jgi:hypothetical protein
MALIGVHGVINSGKDTVGEMLQMSSIDKRLTISDFIADKEHSYYYGRNHSNWQIHRFADNLKDMVCLLLGVSRNVMEDREFKDKPLEGWNVTPRYLMQSLGTEWGRKLIHPDLWVNALFNRYEHAGHDSNHCSGGVERHKTTCLPKWIIPDVRFPNEAQAIKDRDGVIINIIRPDIAKTNHSSETSLNEWQFDHTIINDGTLEDLFNKVKSLQLV